MTAMLKIRLIPIHPNILRQTSKQCKLFESRWWWKSRRCTGGGGGDPVRELFYGIPFPSRGHFIPGSSLICRGKTAHFRLQLTTLGRRVGGKVILMLMRRMMMRRGMRSRSRTFMVIVISTMTILLAIMLLMKITASSSLMSQAECVRGQKWPQDEEDEFFISISIIWSKSYDAADDEKLQLNLSVFRLEWHWSITYWSAAKKYNNDHMIQRALDVLVTMTWMKILMILQSFIARLTR